MRVIIIYCIQTNLQKVSPKGKTIVTEVLCSPKLSFAEVSEMRCRRVSGPGSGAQSRCWSKHSDFQNRASQEGADALPSWHGITSKEMHGGPRLAAWCCSLKQPVNISIKQCKSFWKAQWGREDFFFFLLLLFRHVLSYNSGYSSWLFLHQTTSDLWKDKLFKN